MFPSVPTGTLDVIIMVVRKRGSKWCVMHCHGPKAGTPIKCFPTKQQAEKMHAAIQANKGISYEFVSDSFKLDEVEVKGVKEYYISGYLTSSKKDLVNDIVDPECQEDMLQQLKSGNLKIDVEHELFKKGTGTKTPAGRFVDFRRDAKGLWVKVHLNRNYPNFKEMVEQIRDKFYDAFSIAFRPVKFVMKEINGVKVRILKKILLLNAAITGNPANTDCMFGAIATKSIEEYELFLKTHNMETGDMDADPDVKAKDERPPKAWWDKCTRSVKGIATDPAKLCGWIWQKKQGKKELDSSELMSDAELKILLNTEELKMSDDKNKPEGKEDPKAEGTPPEETPETETDAETKTLEAQVEALTKEVKELKDKGIEEKVAEIKAELLEMEELKEVKEAEEAVKREEKLEILQKDMAELQGMISAPALKGIQDASPSETEAIKELEQKAEEAKSGADKSGPLDSIR